MKVRPLILAAAIAAMATSALPAVAAEQAGHSPVNYGDLDLSTAAGRAELTERFNQAAREMCGITDESAKPSGKQRYCYKTNSKTTKARVATIVENYNQAKGG